MSQGYIVKNYGIDNGNNKDYSNTKMMYKLDN